VWNGANRWGAGLALGALFTFCPGPALAEERVWVTYAAGAGCPSREEFFAAVRARTERFEPASAPAGATTYRVSLNAESDAPSGAPFLGRLEIVDTAGAMTVRQVPGDTCAHVADALALVVALGIDPAATTAPAEAPPAPPPPQPPPPAPFPPAPLPPKPPVTRSKIPETAPSKTRVGFFGAVGANASVGVSPRALVGPALVLEASLLREHANGFAWLPDARLSGTFAASSEPGAAQEIASFHFVVGRLDLCPARATWRQLDGGLCGRVETGRLSAEGSGVTFGQSVAYPWVALGGALRLRWTIVGPLYVELEASVTAPLVREDFFFSQPRRTIENVPAVSAAGAAFLGVHFW
jgi:hypothetical protein